MSPERRAQLEAIVRDELAAYPTREHDPELGMPLTVVGFGAEEVLGAIEVLLSTRVTMGEKVRRFERAWAAYCGQDDGVMVNSGSSANLVMLTALVETGRLQAGDEVLVPAVTWSTSLFPIVQAGLVPVLVDVDPRTLCIDVASAARARTRRTRAVLAVHLLGATADCAAFDDLLVLEDACGAHGARRGRRRVGGLGLAASFSFFFSHHLTTIEGGIVVASDPELLDAMRSIRAHGWIRERSDKDTLRATRPEIDPRFFFVSAGYNLRPTEVQGAFGLAQLPRLDAWVERRRQNHAEWCALLADVPGLTVFPEEEGTVHSGFSFPMLTEGPRAPLMAALERRGVETRPVSGSNLARQPAFERIPARTPVPLTVADAVHERGFFVGNSHAFGRGHGELLAEVIREWSRA